MADVILFRPKALKGEVRAIRPRPSIGLLFVAAPLVANNYQVKIIDEEVNFHWLEDLDREISSSTICVGISSMTGTQILGGLEFARIVKERFNLPVVWGGLHPSMLPEQTIKNGLVDIVVEGEGEEAFLKIVTALKQCRKLENISNVWWKENSQIYSNPTDHFVNLSDIPALPYHLLDCEKYIRVRRSSHPNCKRIFDLNTDRGCPHRCGFCYNIQVNKRKWRALSASEVLEQLEDLVKKFSLDGVNFIADNFFVNEQRVADICTGIIKRKIKITWHADCRIDYFVKYTDSFIDLLTKSGCRMMTFGVESGSPKILNLMHKDINLEDVFKVNEKLKRRRIGVNYHFMAGFPGETKEDVLQTYQTMLKLYERNSDAVFLGPSMYTPYPGTPLYYKCIEMGFIPPDKLEDWGRFGWDEKTCLPFMQPDYLKWLMKSVNVVKSANIFKRVFGSRLLGWWFGLRTRAIIRLNIIGPQIEDRLINAVQFLVVFIKKLLRIK